MIVIAARSAWAQPAAAAGAQPAAPPARSSTAASAKAEAEARAHFNKAVDHFDKAEYREAYTEYLKSLELKPTRAAMGGAASSLKQLGRYDEALDMYEELRRKYPKLPAKMEAMVGPAIAELQGLVGTLVVAGDAPPGASLFIDDRYRSKLPLPEPLRVAVGSHNIRVVKEGFDPITAVVEIAARKENVAELAAQSKQGLLSVSEKHNWVLQVEVDGKDVGATPWQGPVEPGEHRVRLHGLMDADALAACEVAEAKPGENTVAGKNAVKMASPVEAASVRLYEVAPVVLSAEEQDASLKIESAPKGARLRIDAKDVGQTPWEGRLALGEHAIEVVAGGFVPAKQSVTLERRKQRELTVVLERVPLPPPPGFWTARTVGVVAAYGAGTLGLGVFGVAGSLALVRRNDLRDRCGGTSCPQSEQADLDGGKTLGTVATVGLVVGGIGAATGTVVLFALRPGQSKTENGSAHAVVWNAGVGPGGLKLEGRF